MGRGRRIALNTVFLSGAQILGAIGGIIVVGRVAAILEPEGYGMLEGTISYVSLFMAIIFAGIQLILIRDVCEDPEIAPRAVGDALVIRAALLPVFAGGILLFLPDNIRDFGWPLLILAVINGFMVYYLTSFELVFEAFERMWVIAVGTLSCYVVGLTGALLAASWGWGPTGVMGARALSVVAQALVLAAMMRVMYFAPRFDIKPRRYMAHLKRGFPLLVSVTLNQLLVEVGRATLTSTRPASEVGLYSCAATLATKIILFIHALTQAIQPALCKAWLEGKASYADLLGRALRFVIIVTFPVGTGAIFVADDLIRLIYGEDYVEASLVMTILMFAIHLQFMASVLTASVVARGKENWVMLGAALAVGINFGLCLCFIPTYGYLAAGLITLASQAVLVVFFLALQRDVLLTILKHLKLLRVGAANVLMVLVCYLMRDLSGLLIIPVAMALYGLAVLGLRCIDPDEIRAVLGRDEGGPPSTGGVCRDD